MSDLSLQKITVWQHYHQLKGEIGMNIFGVGSAQKNWVSLRYCTVTQLGNKLIKFLSSTVFFIFYFHFSRTSMNCLMEEASKMEKIKFQHIVTIYGVCNSPLGIVMEYMARGSLERILPTHRMSWQLKFRVIHEMGLAMNFLHSMSPPLLHLDLKPGNVLLDGNMHVKVWPWCWVCYFPKKSRVISARRVQNPSKSGSSGTAHERLTCGVFKEQLVNKLHGVLKIIQGIWASTANLRLQLKIVRVLSGSSCSQLLLSLILKDGACPGDSRRDGCEHFGAVSLFLLADLRLWAVQVDGAVQQDAVHRELCSEGHPELHPPRDVPAEQQTPGHQVRCVQVRALLHTARGAGISLSLFKFCFSASYNVGNTLGCPKQVPSHLVLIKTSEIRAQNSQCCSFITVAAEIDFKTIPILAYLPQCSDSFWSGTRGEEISAWLFSFWAQSFAAHSHELPAYVWKFLSSSASTGHSDPRKEGKEDLHGHRNLQFQGL